MIHIPFLRRFLEAERGEHPLALCIKGIDPRFYLLQSFFTGKAEQFRDASSSNMPVLIFPANDDTDLVIVLQRHIADKRSPVLDIKAIAVGA